MGKDKGRRTAKCQTLQRVICKDFPKKLAPGLDFDWIKLPMTTVPVLRKASIPSVDNTVYAVVRRLTQSNLQTKGNKLLQWKQS